MIVLKWLATNWVKIALTIATVIYLPFAFGLIVDAGACAAVVAPDHWYWEFYYRYLACREINVLGDTFAGFFAPLAFIWLAGAVYIQSQELAAQRDELNETQQLMLQQLAVSEQQVEETRASTALFKEQTRILKRQQDQRDAEIADQIYDSAVAAFKEKLRDLSAISIFIRQIQLADRGSARSRQHLSELRIPPRSAPDDKFWGITNGYEEDLFEGISNAGIVQLFRTLRFRADYVVSGHPIETPTVLTIVFRREKAYQKTQQLIDFLDHLLSLTNNTSDVKKNEIEVTKLHETKAMALSILEWLDQADALRKELIEKGSIVDTE